MAAYDKDDFIEACRAHRDRVIVSRPAEKDAFEYLGLRDKQALLDFIGNGGMEECVLDNTRAYEKWKGKPPAPMVDSYRFKTGPKVVYLAFYKGFDGKWILKSLKMDMRTAPLNMPFKDLAKRMGLECEEESGGSL